MSCTFALAFFVLGLSLQIVTFVFPKTVFSAFQRVGGVYFAKQLQIRAAVTNGFIKVVTLIEEAVHTWNGKKGKNL